MSDTYTKGDKFIWNDGVCVEITRVAKDQTWADLRCWTSINVSWTKRQTLPLPESFVREYWIRLEVPS